MIFGINCATQITLLRILLTPYIVMTILYHQWGLALLLSAIAAITDYLDGYWARRYHQETEFGKMMDPVADKIFIFATLWALHIALENNIIPTWFMIVLAAKELFLIVGALFLIKNKYGVISPSIYAKWVTALLMVSIIFIILAHCSCIPTFFTTVKVDVIFKIFAVSIIGICIDYGYKAYKIIRRVS